MICGIGTDLVENDRVAKIIAKWGSKFLQRIFSNNEISYCSKHVYEAINYGARFAAKESFLKALGIGLGRGVKLNEIEVVHDINGKPELNLCGAAKKQIEKRKITKIHLSLTHTKRYAAAIVLLENNE